MELNSFLNKVQGSNELDFGDIFSKSIDLFKKTWAQGFLNLLFTFIFILPIIILIYAPIIAFAMNQQQQYNSEYSPQEFPIEMIFTTIGVAIIGGLVLGAFIFALKAGFYNVIKKIDEGKEVNAKDHFVFFKAEYLKKTFVISLMTMGISILAMILCYLPIIYVMVPLSLTSIIFAFNTHFSPSNVIKAAFSLGNKKWLMIFGLLFISGLLAEMVGLLLCGIGIFFTMSFVYLPIYIVYKQVIGFEDSDEIQQIGME
jgi:hypothetical protein